MATAFRGLNNKQDPSRLGLGGRQRRKATDLDWATQVTNLDLDDSQAYLRRRGRTAVGEGGTSAFATRDENHLYLVRGSVLYHVNAGLEQTALYTGLTPAAPAQFVELNDRVYFANGAEFLVLEGPTARPWGLPVPPQPGVTWAGDVGLGAVPAGQYQFAVTYRAPDGRESGASPVVVRELEAGGMLSFTLPQLAGHTTLLYAGLADGEVLYRISSTHNPATYWNGRVDDTGPALRTAHRYPPPGGHVVGEFQGRVALGQYLPEEDKSVVWLSDPLSYEHFDLYNFIMLNGEIRSMTSDSQALYLGTDRQIQAYTAEGALRTVFEYGMPRGTFMTKTAEGEVLMWTNRGLCGAGQDGFMNLTERAVSVPPGTAGGLAVVEQDGFRKALVVVREDGQPHNVWES